MRAIRRIVSFIAPLALALSLFGGNAQAQQKPVVTAAVPSVQDNIAKSICDSKFPEGATYTGSEYRNGKSSQVTMTYTLCEDMPATHGTQKFFVHFNRQKSGAALEKGVHLEFIVEGLNSAKWRLMHSPHDVKSRQIVFNPDGSYVEKLIYVDGSTDNITFRRTK